MWVAKSYGGAFGFKSKQVCLKYQNCSTSHLSTSDFPDVLLIYYKYTFKHNFVIKSEEKWFLDKTDSDVLLNDECLFLSSYYSHGFQKQSVFYIGKTMK